MQPNPPAGSSSWFSYSEAGGTSVRSATTNTSLDSVAETRRYSPGTTARNTSDPCSSTTSLASASEPAGSPPDSPSISASSVPGSAPSTVTCSVPGCTVNVAGSSSTASADSVVTVSSGAVSAGGADGGDVAVESGEPLQAASTTASEVRASTRPVPRRDEDCGDMASSVAGRTRHGSVGCPWDAGACSRSSPCSSTRRTQNTVDRERIG